MDRHFIHLILGFACLALSPSLRACSIPVFRYALERWQPSPYEVVIFRQGNLPEAAGEAARRLADARARANLRLVEVNLAGTVDPRWQKVWKTQESKAKLPWVTVRFPESDEDAKVFWSGPLNMATVTDLLESPCRSKVAANLSRGESAVFLLLTSGDKDRDDSAAQLIEKTAVRLQKSIELPMPTPDGPQLLYDLPLNVSFPIVRISRTDPREQFFIQSLLQSDEAPGKTDCPILFPIFGRGRLLCALTDDDLCAERIEKVANFLCSACSCQVKELNPGVDLLLSVDWTEKLGEPIADVEPAVSLRPTLPRQGADITRSQVELRMDRTIWSDRRMLLLAIGGTSGLVLLTGFWLLRSRRNQTES